MERERRVIECRLDASQPRKLRGTAVHYSSLSHFIGVGVRERIDKNAFTRSLAKRSRDVLACVEHDESKLLARSSAGTLRLRNNDEGLDFELDVPDTQLGRDTWEMCRMGNYRGMSFAFSCNNDEMGFENDIDEETGDELDERVVVRNVLDADLYHIAVVATPAYEATSVAARNLVVAANVEARANAFALANKNPQEIDAQNRLRVAYLRGEMNLL